MKFFRGSGADDIDPEAFAIPDYVDYLKTGK